MDTLVATRLRCDVLLLEKTTCFADASLLLEKNLMRIAVAAERLPADTPPLQVERPGRRSLQLNVADTDNPRY